MDNKSTAKLLGFSVSSFYRIDKAGLNKLEERLLSNTPKMNHVSLDAVAYEKYHQYATVLTNQEDSKMVDIYLGKSKASALALFEKYDDKMHWLGTVLIRELIFRVYPRFPWLKKAPSITPGACL